MIEQRTSTYTVSDPSLYRGLIKDGSIKTAVNERGGTIKSLKEIKKDVWRLIMNIDYSHPEVSSLIHALEKFNLTFTPVELTKIENLDQQEELKGFCSKIKKEIESAKLDLLPVT